MHTARAGVSLLLLLITACDPGSSAQIVLRNTASTPLWVRVNGGIRDSLTPEPELLLQPGAEATQTWAFGFLDTHPRTVVARNAAGLQIFCQGYQWPGQPTASRYLVEITPGHLAC